MSRRGATLGVAVLLAVGLGAGAANVTVPYVGLGPGPVYNTLGSGSDGKPLIQVEGHPTYPASGELDLTTVNVYDKLTLHEALRYWFDRSFAIVPREVIFPPDQSPAQSEAETRREMTESQQHAVTAALCELGTPVRATVVVDDVSDGSPAEKAGLHKGDLITKVDGKKVDSVCTLRRLTGTHRPGETLTVTYRRGSGVKEVVVHTVPGLERDGRPLLGVGLNERNPKPPFTVRIALTDVGGPSAGMMFALGIIDRLTPGPLTGGKRIAGTGTIDDDGTVGPIGGIQQKLVAARQRGARFFLTPDGNWDEARRATPKGLTLVRVATLEQALAAVRDIANKP